MDECPSFAAQKNKLKNMSPSNPERQKLLESIKKRICDKTTQLVCCERKDSRCVAVEDEIIPQVSSSSSSFSIIIVIVVALKNKVVLQSLGNSCDPANGSCLPDVERFG